MNSEDLHYSHIPATIISDLAGALISRIIKNDISKSEEVSRDSYNLPEENQGKVHLKFQLEVF